MPVTTVLLAVAVLLYAAASGAAGASLFKAGAAAEPWGRRLLMAGTSIHGAALLARAVVMRIPPVTSGIEGLSLLALLVAVVFLVFQRSYPIKAMTVLVAPLACLHLAAALLFGPQEADVPPALRTGYFVVHITLAFLGNALLALAAAAGAAFVLQERNLRLKNLHSPTRALPNLTVADQVAWRCATVGFLFMTLGIASGMLYSKHAWQAYWMWDPRQTWSLMTWMLYAGLLHVRLISGWHGRRWAWLTMGAFTLVVGASVVLDVFKLGRHAGTYEARPPAVGGVL